MAKVKKLAPDQVQAKLAALPQWSESGGVLQRTYQAKDFMGAMRFVNSIADLAEKRQHHPDMLIRWNKVTLSLSTHDAGGITQRDFDLASEADALAP